VYKHIEAWRNPPIEGDYSYVYFDGVVLKRSWAGECKNVSVLVAIGVDQAGYRRIFGVTEGQKKDKSGCSDFLAHLKQHGLKGVRLIISDACIGLSESVAEYYPDADWQRCTMHCYRNVFSHVPNSKVKQVANRLKAIHAQESLAAAQQKVEAIIEQLRTMKMPKAVQLVENSIGETLTYYHYPDTHWRCIRTNKPLERITREIRQQTRVLGTFSNGASLH
jgi:transposase-like protein